MIQEETVTLRRQTPEAPNEWLYETVIVDGEEKREFKPYVYLGKNAEPWPECEDRYKEGYELLWSLRQEEHTEEERAALEAQYAAWCAANPDLVEEIDNAVHVKPEPPKND